MYRCRLGPLLVGIFWNNLYMNLHIQLVEMTFSFFASTLISFVLKYLQYLAFSPLYLWCFYRQVEFVLFAKSENLDHMS